jgi:hypothetical protein
VDELKTRGREARSGLRFLFSDPRDAGAKRRQSLGTQSG